MTHEDASGMDGESGIGNEDTPCAADNVGDLPEFPLKTPFPVEIFRTIYRMNNSKGEIREKKLRCAVFSERFHLAKRYRLIFLTTKKHEGTRKKIMEVASTAIMRR